MARHLELHPTRTYATRENAIKAAEKKCGHLPVRFIVMVDEYTGRFFPVFIGQECLQYGIHLEFNILA